MKKYDMVDPKNWKTIADNNKTTGVSQLAYRLLLGDGTVMSIQASKFHYCSPRKDMKSFHDYDSFEIGFPTCIIPEIMDYAEDPENPTGTVYGYVPSEIIDQVIKSRGGVSCTISFEG